MQRSGTYFNANKIAELAAFNKLKSMGRGLAKGGVAKLFG